MRDVLGGRIFDWDDPKPSAEAMRHRIAEHYKHHHPGTDTPPHAVFEIECPCGETTTITCADCPFPFVVLVDDPCEHSARAVEAALWLADIMRAACLAE